MSENELSFNDSQCHDSDEELNEFADEDLKSEVDEDMDGVVDDEEEEEEEVDDDELAFDIKSGVKDVEDTIKSAIKPEEGEEEQSSDKWSPLAFARLLSRMKSAVCNADSENQYDSYAQQEMLDWERIAFRPFSVDDCKEKWAKVSKDLRRFRFLAELVEEVASTQGVVLSRRRSSNSLDGSDEDPAGPDPPTKPQTALQLFVTSVRDKLESQNKSRHITASAYGHVVKSWKTHPERERIVFIRRAMEFWKDYEKKADEYQKANPKYRPFPCTVTKEERALLDKVSGKPARPAGSPYVMFLQDTLPTLKHHQPKNRMAVVSRMWSELEEEKRAVYQEKFNATQKEYRQALVNYEMKPFRKAAAKRKREDSTGDPAESATNEASNDAFAFFTKVVGPALQSATPSGGSDGGSEKGADEELAKRLIDIWEKLTEEQKKIYESRPPTEKESVSEDFLDFSTSATASSSAPDAAEVERVRHRIARQLMAGAPKKPPSCAYHLFLRETYPKLTDLPQKERTRLLAKHWTTLPAEAKKPFALRTAEMQRDYETSFAEFLETIPPETRDIVRNRALTRRKNARRGAGGRIPKLGVEAGNGVSGSRDTGGAEDDAVSVPRATSSDTFIHEEDPDGTLELELDELVREESGGGGWDTRLKISIGAEENSGFPSDTETESGDEEV